MYMFSGAGPKRMRPAVSYCEPWQGQNQPPNSPCWPSGMHPRCVHTWIITIHSSLPGIVRLASVAGASAGEIGVAGERILEVVERDLLRLLHFLFRAVADHDRLAAPVDDDRLALLDRRDVDLDRGERQRRGVGVHLVDEGPDRGGGADGGEGAGSDQQEIAPRHARGIAVFGSRRRHGLGRVSQIVPLALDGMTAHAARHT